MVDTDNSAAPHSSVMLEPSESLSFNLSPQSSPQAVLTIRNISDHRKIAFKVKTTRPLRYLVRPNQGMLGPNATASIMVILQQKDCDELLRLDPSERQLSNDKFLVQSIYVDDSFYELVKTKSAKEMADELTTMWANTDKRCLANKKLRCRFVQGDDPHAASLPRQDSLDRFPSNPLLTARAASNDDLSAFAVGQTTETEAMTAEQLTSALLDEPAQQPVGNQAAEVKQATPPGSGNGKQEASFQEVAALRKKYDELVAFTLLQKASADAQRAKKDDLSGSTLRQRKTGANGTSSNDDSYSSTAKPGAVKESPQAFGLFHLLICAIIFFLIGRFY
ncbi:hypothetical protein Poli38472_009096 [Pythium oligandrum]|uniref:MSP domain-containing protein n=1 Tax=Pythium oligandrum TaxID=41045 RepID=A0A8K1CJY0_PYTOL|nr:hypothetical protein Poli38472_009096 [Pythium oligandrum]|eukprot:TMW64929.1 hypothetical protein Poli38472_009096 [Pythium oligandrum]